MRFMARLGNGDCSSRRMCRREVSQLALAAACLMPLPLAAADTTAASHAVTGPTVGLRWAELAQVDQTQLLDAFRSYTIFPHMWRISTTIAVSASSFCQTRGA